MKKLFLLLLVPVLYSCSIRMVAPVKPNQAANTKSVFLVGKISFDPALNQKLDWTAPKDDWEGVMYVFFKKDADSSCVNALEADLTAKQKWDEYFVWEFPRENLYFRHIMILLGKENTTSTYLTIDYTLPFNFNPDEQFVYIGDLTFHFGVKNEMGGKDDILEVRDNSKKVIGMYDHYLTGPNGKPVIPSVRLLKGGKVKAELYRETVRMH